MLTEENTTLDLSGFTGTESYHGYGSLIGSLLTDGTYHLAENAQAYWLFDLIDSHLLAHKDQPFAVTTLTVDLEHSTAEAVITDGDDTIIARQSIGYTDFPLPEIKIYSVLSGVSPRTQVPRWIHLLPSEY